MGGGGGRCSNCSTCCVGNCGNCCDKYFTPAELKKFEELKAAELEAKTVERAYEALKNVSDKAIESRTKFEDSILRQSRKDLDDLKKDIRLMQKMGYRGLHFNIDTDNIDRQNQRTEDKIRGYSAKYINRRISYDDPECREILRMETGEDKTKKIENFFASVFRESIADLPEMLKDCIESQSDYIMDSLHNTISQVTAEKARSESTLALAKSAFEGDGNDREKFLISQIHDISTCAFAEGLISEDFSIDRK